MPLTCIIVDDEPLAVKLMESYVAKTPDLELLGSFTDSVEAINAVKEQKPNLLFLDIQMPDLNGMELAHMIPTETRVIFTTAFKEYAFESYEVSALDFLLKPIRYNKFMVAVEKAKEWFNSRNEEGELFCCIAFHQSRRRTAKHHYREHHLCEWHEGLCDVLLGWRGQAANYSPHNESR